MNKTRRKFFKTAGVTALATIMGTSCNSSQTQISHKSPTELAQIKKPNILWISCEDIGTELNCYGDGYSTTPNIDRFATQGCLYTNAFVPFPVCAPTRSAIITGIHPGTLGSMHMRTKDKNYEAVPPSFVKCFPEYLRTAGYYCSNNSKTDYQFTTPFTVWDAYEGDWRNQRRPANAPFFAVINLMVTHESNCWDLKKVIHDPEKATVPPYYPDTPIVRRNLARYYDNITAMDETVGDILSQLEKDGLTDNTVVFFWSDHGGLPRQKRWSYDSGLRVPLIIRYPGKITPGSVSDELINFVDLAPTVLALAGVKVPETMQGRVFIGENKSPAPKYVFGGRNRMDEATDFIRTVRDQRYRYIRNFMPEVPYAQDISFENKMPIMQEWRRLNQEGKLTGAQQLFFQPTKPQEEFYDLKNDPYEINNLATNPQHQAKIEEMRTALEQWMEKTNDLGSLPEEELIEKMWPGKQQPITATPTIKSDRQNNEKILVTLNCLTEGASIGYQLNGQKYWFIYQQPFLVDVKTKLIVQAIRIGYQASPEIVTVVN